MARARLRGKRIVFSNLDDAKDSLRGRGAVAAVVSGALIVSNRAKELAPVLTGTLLRSIHVGGNADRNPDHASEFVLNQLPPPRRTFKGIVAFVGTNVFYAPFPEFGTSRMVARPYMRPALDESRDAVQKEIADALNDVLDRAV